MLNVVLFIADTNLAALLRGMAGKSNEFAIESIVELMAGAYWAGRVLGTTTPDVLLVETTDVARDLPLLGSIRSQCPNIPLVSLASRDLVPYLTGTSFITWPFTVEQLENSIEAAVHQADGAIYENLVAFLPGKAGSGASTVVLQVAHIIAKELKRKVLVLEGDLHSGLLSAMLGLPVKTSIREALADAPQATGMIWQRYITEAGGADFLLTNTEVKEPVPAWTHYLKLLRFAGTKYDLMIMDLPEVVNTATAEAVRRARAVYVVTTPEFASLRLAQQRCRELEKWGVHRDRIHSLLNRGHKDDLDAKGAEEVLGYPVVATLPNDYKGLRKAANNGRFVEIRSDLGQAYLDFSRMLMGVAVEKKASSWFRK